MKAIRKKKEKNPGRIVVLILLILFFISIAGVLIHHFFLENEIQKEEMEEVSNMSEDTEEKEPGYITETCFDGEKEVDPVLFSIPFDKGIGEYIKNKDIVQKMDENEIKLLQEKANECIKLLYGTNSNAILSDYEDVEHNILNLFQRDIIWYDESDNEKTINLYIADYLKALADNKYQVNYCYQTDKSLIWFNNCYYVRGLLQLQVQECKDGKELLDYCPIAFEKGKAYRIVVDLGFTTDVVNGTQEYTLTEIKYVLAEESKEDIKNPELLEIK